MGNIFSNEEKLHREKFLAGRNSGRIVGMYEYYGYDHINASVVNKEKAHRYIKRRNLSFHGRNGRNYYYKSKSHSLNAILEDLYSFGPGKDIREGRDQFVGSVIPRIPLKGNRSASKEGKNRKTLRKMSSESEIYFGDETSLHKRLNHDLNANISQNTPAVIMNDENFEISKKPDDSYFAKNFDDCMKRLEVIEKEFNLIENVDADNQFCQLGRETDVEIVETSPTPESTENYDSETDDKSCDNRQREEKVFEDHHPTLTNQERDVGKNEEDGDVGAKETSETAETVKTESPGEDVPIHLQQNKESISQWYSNLKQQFEVKEPDNQQSKPREMSCRITGATLKTPNEKTKPEEKEKDTRHYFSTLVKTNRSLIDEELPDPDKVKHIRAMFQETLNSTLRRKLDKKLGGSLQNISCRAAEQHMARPMSAQCCRHEPFGETANSQPPEDQKDIDPSAKQGSKPLRDRPKDLEIENTKKKLFEKYEKELKPVRDYKSRRVLQTKWTDTGSVSSGVSSDLSSYDTDLESYSREGTEQDEMTVSDDDLLEEVKDKHYVQNEVLEKIRSYGTSVTYFGGEMLTCSIGPLFSPTTQAIMEEIEEKYGNEANTARTFDEFYRKYVEANDHGRKIKVGRTRSFGHSDVFQKPNVLSNTEIDLYKNDLEIEIGIKKPTGIPQNSLKRKVTKSTSLGSETKMADKSEDMSCPDVVPAAESNTTKEELRKENEIVNDDAEEIITATATSEPKVDEKSEITEETVEEKPEMEIKDEKKETKKSSSEKEFLRSKSAPEGLSVPKKCEATLNSFQSPAKEIYFSYEKSLFNGNRKSDMEFEEFEVCESLSEKLEKLEKQNSEGSTTSSDAIPDSRLSKRSEEDTNQELHITPTEDRSSAEDTGKAETSASAPASAPVLEGSNGSIPNEKKEQHKYNHSRWPIETTVMVDIQKEDEQTPKIITNRKTVAKAKVRLF